MSVETTAIYRGTLRCEASHTPSGRTLITDAPIDNHGKGESFSPTDMVGTALGTCMLTTMAIVAERSKIDVAGSTCRVEKTMVTDPTRRIGTLAVEMHLPEALSTEDRKRMEDAAMGCPVHRSLHPNVKTPVEFVYDI